MMIFDFLLFYFFYLNIVDVIDSALQSIESSERKKNIKHKVTHQFLNHSKKALPHRYFLNPSYLASNQNGNYYATLNSLGSVLFNETVKNVFDCNNTNYWNGCKASLVTAVPRNKIEDASQRSSLVNNTINKYEMYKQKYHISTPLDSYFPFIELQDVNNFKPFSAINNRNRNYHNIHESTLSYDQTNNVHGYAEPQPSTLQLSSPIRTQITVNSYSGTEKELYNRQKYIILNAKQNMNELAVTQPMERAFYKHLSLYLQTPFSVGPDIGRKRQDYAQSVRRMRRNYPSFNNLDKAHEYATQKNLQFQFNKPGEFQVTTNLYGTEKDKHQYKKKHYYHQNPSLLARDIGKKRYSSRYVTERLLRKRRNYPWYNSTSRKDPQVQLTTNLYERGKQPNFAYETRLPSQNDIIANSTIQEDYDDKSSKQSNDNEYFQPILDIGFTSKYVKRQAYQGYQFLPTIAPPQIAVPPMVHYSIETFYEQTQVTPVHCSKAPSKTPILKDYFPPKVDSAAKPSAGQPIKAYRVIEISDEMFQPGLDLSELFKGVTVRDIYVTAPVTVRSSAAPSPKPSGRRRLRPPPSRRKKIRTTTTPTTTFRTDEYETDDYETETDEPYEYYSHGPDTDIISDHYYYGDGITTQRTGSRGKRSMYNDLNRKRSNKTDKQYYETILPKY